MSDIEKIVRAVIIHERKILLCRAKMKKYYFLPGGHVESGESQEVALAREIKEETGKDIISTRYLEKVPNSYLAAGVYHNEVNYVYAAELSNYDILSIERHIDFMWISISALRNAKVLPENMKQVILLFLNKEVMIE